MKSSIKLAAFALFLLLMMPARMFAQDASVSTQVFYDQLSPYGSWVDYQNYGYVWIPNAGQGFTPYGTNGHWVLTDDGWTWVSDYSWGWAPFHYGRWVNDDSYGWLWVPGNEWGPAWVSWRRSPGYYGWAPMGPGISLEVSFGSGYRVPNNQWTFVGEHDMNRRDLDGHYVDRSRNVTIINNSTVINNSYTDNGRHTTYAAGPRREDVQKSTGTTIRPSSIHENGRPGQAESGGQLSMYRPQMAATGSNGQKPAPAKPVALKDVKPVSERSGGGQLRADAAPAKATKDPAPAKSVRAQPRDVPQQEKPKSAEPAQAAPADKGALPHEPTMVSPKRARPMAQHANTVVPKSPSVTKGPPKQPRTAHSPKTHTNVRPPSAPKRIRQAPNPSGNRSNIEHTPPPNGEKHI